MKSGDMEMETLRLLECIEHLMKACKAEMKYGSADEAAYYARLAARYALQYLNSTFGC